MFKKTDEIKAGFDFIYSSKGTFPATSPQEFLIEGEDGCRIIPAGRLSMLYGPGGTGKSYLALQIAVALAEKEDLFSWKPCDKISVLYISLEDALSTIQWRVNAIKTERKQGPDIWAPEGLPVDFFDTLRKVMSVNKYKLIIIDPLISMISGMGKSENDNADMQQLISEIRKICKDFNTAILLIHHTNKDSRKDGEQASGTALRGASAIGDGCRFMMSMDRKVYYSGRGNDRIKQESEEIFISNTKNNFARKWAEMAVRPGNDGVLQQVPDVELLRQGRLSGMTAAQALKLLDEED